MQNEMKKKAAGYLSQNRWHRGWKKAVSALACVVVFCTVYALILPAITMEKEPQCGKTEHTHSEACYAKADAGSRGALICTIESLNLHRHTDDCQDENGEYICGYSDFVVHEHNASCFDEDGNLWCSLPEIKAHTHDESCYARPETEPAHTHTDECYTTERGDLICTVPEGEGAHIHSTEQGCYDENGELTCQTEEYAGHVHTDDCFSQNKVLICELSTDPAEEADGPQLICDKPQIILHEHKEDCFDEYGNLVCGKTQVLEHVHSQDCFETADEPEDENTLICNLEEHTHSAACPVIGMIEALPNEQSVEERMAAFEEAGDEEGSSAYLADLQARVQEAYDAYTALPEDEQAKVTNLDRLTALDWLRCLSLQETAAVTVTNGDGTSATATPWAGDTGSARKHLQAALVSVDQGYTIQSVEYYQIDNLTDGKASVTYNSGGLSAANSAKVFVYDLGADGMATPQSCTVENDAQANDQFTSFDFTVPAECANVSHVFAFASAATSTLEELGIYLGEQQTDGSWVAYDAANEEDANVMATITLPDGVTVPDGYKPFIRKINPGEGYYPSNDAVDAKAGASNGWQCYTIRWLKQDDTGLHMEPLNKNGTATVTIDYLKDAAQLPGPAGARKLVIYNSNTDGSLVNQVAETVENVRVDGDYYDGFTFQAVQSGPYVFVSKTVEKGYIQALGISSIIDGSAPFDGDDQPGNDSSPSNQIVRSYDSIQYNLDATFAARQESVVEKSVNMYFELTLRKSATAARFDISKMLWLGDNYSVEYLDDAGNVIMIMAHDGKYYQPKKENGAVVRDEHGFALADTNQPVPMNAQVNGSTAGGNSYKVTSGGVATQRLVGWTRLTAKGSDDSILSGTQSFPMAIGVRNADNGEIFAPTFRMWLEGNEENYGPETASEGGLLEPAQPDPNNVVDINDDKNAQYRITVSAGTNFNIQLKKNTEMSYKNWFDFSTGQAVAEPTRTELVRLANLEENHGKSNPAEFTENGAALSSEKQAEYANYRYGRITGYGITLQLYNNIQSTDDKDAKMLKGLSLPVGDITFDLNFSSEVRSDDGGVKPGEYTAILWDYNENVPANTSRTYQYVDPGRGTVTTPGDGKGNGGRNLYWNSEYRSPYARCCAPYNYTKPFDGCYYGGDWAIMGKDGKADSLEKLNQIASPTVVTGTGKDTIYHFSVSDYDFDFDNQLFPTKDAGSSPAAPGYDTYAWCFSAGYVQVLSVFPMVQEVSEAEIFLHTTVNNLQLTTRAGQKLAPKAEDATKIQHEVYTKDNTRRDQIVLYAPGNLGKGSSFNGRYGVNNQTEPTKCAAGYLGTNFWDTSYDCSTFAGDDIWIIGCGLIGAGSDYRTRSMNLLQLFDSRALSIRGEPQLDQTEINQSDIKGEANYLYAADPDYPGGYDTNVDGMLAYMNTVREEDLVYSTEMPDADGYITVNGQEMKCVGVLMELRGCDVQGGQYQYMRFPVHVNGDDETLVGKTVATVNTFRVWSWDLGDMTWANGHWDGTQNELKDFPKPTNTGNDDGFSAELANGTYGRASYVKTEYKDGLQVVGTHAGGVTSGNSLLILGYKAGINIGVDNKESTGMISYNLGDGETVVDYRLKNIRTEVSDFTSQTGQPLTDLTINTVLDEGYTGNQRISVSGGSYRIKGYAVNGESVDSEETSIVIGTDPEHPTELEFVGSDGNRHRIKVYAQLGANSQSVKFVIQNAPVGLYLPDITFQANFAAVTALKNNDTIKTSTYISGTSDNRAYDQTKGNTDNVTVGVVLRSGTNLTKAVSTRYIELDGLITYDVTYTNSGTDTIPKIYFYDLLPNPADIRDSDFSGKVVLRDFQVISSQEDGAAQADATVYYSSMEYKPLYDKVSKFGEGATPEERAADVERMLADTKVFNPLAHVTGGQFQYDSFFDEMTPAEITEYMSKVTGLYAKVENLHKGQTVTLQFTVRTDGNKADDWYKNIANSWIAGSGTLPLTSNKVETQVVSRTVSGVVWHDLNFDGVRAENEPKIQGVTATLFRNDGENYVLCTQDVKGTTISPVTTGADGVYAFHDLAAGDYIVAFSGKALETYTGATGYQVNGQNDTSTNDGKAVPKTDGSVFDPNAYAYYIHFSKDGAQMSLHTISKMGTVTLNKGVEMYANQDLGLIVATYELPQTGGAGTTLYTMGGLLLIAGVGSLLFYINKKRRKEDFASS